MKHLLIGFALAFVGFAAQAQTIPATLNVSWEAPTKSTPEGFPLTGALAITEYQLVISTDVIPANFSGTPTLVVTAPTLVAAYTLDVVNRSTIHARARACNKPGGILDCSIWTDEGLKPVNLSTTPSPPTNVVIDLHVTF